MKKRRESRIRPGPLIVFLVYVLIAGIIGMVVNDHYYAVERGAVKSQQQVP